MSATPFTRRKFLISTAAAASSAWFWPPAAVVRLTLQPPHPSHPS